MVNEWSVRTGRAKGHATFDSEPALLDKVVVFVSVWKNLCRVNELGDNVEPLRFVVALYKARRELLNDSARSFTDDRCRSTVGSLRVCRVDTIKRTVTCDTLKVRKGLC